MFCVKNSATHRFRIYVRIYKRPPARQHRMQAPKPRRPSRSRAVEGTRGPGGQARHGFSALHLRPSKEGSVCLTPVRRAEGAPGGAGEAAGSSAGGGCLFCAAGLLCCGCPSSLYASASGRPRADSTVATANLRQQISLSVVRTRQPDPFASAAATAATPPPLRAPGTRTTSGADGADEAAPPANRD